MRGNKQQPKSSSSSSLSLKAILICCCVLLTSLFFFILFIIIRSTLISNPHLNSSSSNSYSSSISSINEEGASASASSACNKIPGSLANALVHYATSNITPQQTAEEISVSLRVLKKKSPCNFLVFGLGHDSLMWASLNHGEGGRTVFLEEDKSWMERMSNEAYTTSLESYHVVYRTKMTEAEELHQIGVEEEGCKVVSDPRTSKCSLALKGLPSIVYETEWDVIMVDAPTGYHEGAPGRMTAIYTAGLMARNNRKKTDNTDVFVHDVDRIVEDKFSKSFLCQGYMVEQQGRIRHFNIPTHRSTTPFCPLP